MLILLEIFAAGPVHGLNGFLRSIQNTYTVSVPTITGIVNSVEIQINGTIQVFLIIFFGHIIVLLSFI